MGNFQNRNSHCTMPTLWKKLIIILKRLKYHTKHPIISPYVCEKKGIITMMMLVPEPTTSAETHVRTCGFLHANTSANAVTAEFPTAWDHSVIISQQMFSFMYSHTFNLLLFSSWIELNNMAATCSGHEREPRFGN